MKGKIPNWINDAFESYEAIKWGGYILKAQKIVIVAFFIEEWVGQYSKQFDKFTGKENFNLTVYLPDYENLQLLTELKDLIPEYNQQELSNKIQDSIQIIQKKTGDRHQNVQVKLYNRPFRYTYQLFDKLMFLSFNELAREKKYLSPFILFDLANSKVLSKFFVRETTALEEASRTINLFTWKRQISESTI